MGLRVGLVALVMLPDIALACLPGESVFMSCVICDSGARLEVCSTATDVTYRFGPPGRPPDLELSVPLRAATYEPWNGVGRAIAEGVTFRNGDYAYEVYAGFDRMFDEADTAEAPVHFGGVRVTRNDTPVVDATCLPETVDFGWSPVLWDQMHDLGLRWDDRARAWQEPL